MARARNPKRDEAFQIFLDSDGQAKLKDIAAQVGIPDSRIRKWKTEDKWDDKIKERSDSAKGALLLNKGSEKEQIVKKGRGGQPRNGNAVKTGEYQTIWLDYLNENERAFYDGINTDKDIQANVTLRNLTFRENLMMKRLFELQEGIDNIETSTVQERVSQTAPMEVYDESTCGMQIKSTTMSKMQIKQIIENKKSMLDEILRIEEALTRIQDKKAKLLQTKHKIELDAERLEIEKRRVDIMANKHDIDVISNKQKDNKENQGIVVQIVDDVPEVDEDDGDDNKD